MAEGARLESVFRGNSNVGSNPTLSARISKKLLLRIPTHSWDFFTSEIGHTRFCKIEASTAKNKTALIGDWVSTALEGLHSAVTSASGTSNNKRHQLFRIEHFDTKANVFRRSPRSSPL